jgi:hypothetical protein
VSACHSQVRRAIMGAAPPASGTAGERHAISDQQAPSAARKWSAPVEGGLVEQPGE